jgi:holo-[acyl-carrier protein] synthase
MMLLDHGIDIVPTARIKALLERHAAFAEEVFTAGERAYCFARRHPHIHFAGRFAAKEAYVKALGRGLATTGVDAIFQEIEVVERSPRKPILRVTGWAARLLCRRGFREVALSISHDADYAVASVLLIGRRAQHP